MTSVTVDLKYGVQEECGGLGGDSHTHSPAEARDQGSPAGFGGEGGCPGHDTDSRVTDAAACILFALKSPPRLIVLAVIMAATRQHPVAIWAGPTRSSLAKLTASRRASSLVRSLAAERRPGSSST